MSIPQVGQGAVAVFATFKGMRKAADAEFGTIAKSGRSIFDRGFRSAGATAGKGFSASFDSATKGITSATLKQAQADVAKASREVSTLRLREADAAGKVRIAEAALAEARRKYAADSSQAIRAEERLAAAQRQSVSAKENLLGATNRLSAAQRELAQATTTASAAGGRAGGTFARLGGVFGSAGRDGASRFTQGFKDVLGGVIGANILTGIGYTIGRGIGTSIRAGIGYTLDSITLASDLEQSTGAVSAQFKDQADTIFDAARRANTGVGLSRATFQQYSAVVGAQLKNLGLREEDVADQTIDLIGLGADLAAQFGGPTSTAVEALSSLLRGERDPIERYGVSLKQADIDARLAEKGLKGLTGEAEKQATIAATLELLWEQTADSIGTFADESDTYAGKLQRLEAQLADAQTGFGEALLPTATDVLQFANDDLLPILKGTLAAVGPEINQSLRDSLPAIESTLKTIAEGLPAAIDLGAKITEGISGSINGDFSDRGIIGGFGEDGILTRLGELYDEAKRESNEFGYSYQRSWEFYLDAFDLLWDGTYDRMRNQSRELQAVWNGVAVDALKALDAQAMEFIRTGELWGDGLAEGFRNRRQTVREEARLLAGEAIQASAEAMGIRSPATKGIYQGEMWGAGVEIGMRRRTDGVRSAAEMLATAASYGSPAITGASSGGTGAGSSRPIEMDGRLFGVFEELADGRARIVLADVVSAAGTAVLGKR